MAKWQHDGNVDPRVSEQHPQDSSIATTSNKKTTYSTINHLDVKKVRQIVLIGIQSALQVIHAANHSNKNNNEMMSQQTTKKSSERIASMNALMNNLLNDEAGFLLSAELVLIATLGVLALIVGLSEVAGNINAELQDVGRAFGSINQSFNLQGQNGMGGSSYSNSPHTGSDIQAGGSMGEQ